MRLMVAVALTALIFGSCGYTAGVIDDDALLPLPRSLQLVNTDKGDCGQGNDYECGRIFVVTGSSRAGEEVTGAVVAHLERAKGWNLDRLGGEASGCKRNGHFCVRVQSFDDYWSYDAGSADELRATENAGVSRADVPRLERVAAVAVFSDCCGEPF